MYISFNFEFIKEGYEVMNRYGRNSFAKSGQAEIPRNYCFDDLGTENNLKYFGNECNVRGEILLSRYDLFINKKVKEISKIDIDLQNFTLNFILPNNLKRKSFTHLDMLGH